MFDVLILLNPHNKRNFITRSGQLNNLSLNSSNVFFIPIPVTKDSFLLYPQVLKTRKFNAPGYISRLHFY